MAIVVSGQSKTKGKIGNTTTYVLNGVQVIRSLPIKKRNRKVSALQKLHRGSFIAQQALARSVKRQLIDRIWSHLSYKGGMNPYNQFIKSNSQSFGQTDYIALPEFMVISKGSLLPAQGFTAKKEGENINFTWETGYEGKNAMPSNRLNLVVLSSRKALNMVAVNAKRKDGKASISVPDKDAEFTEGYAFWSSEDDQCFSASIYWWCK